MAPWARSGGRSQPSLEPVGEKEEHDADQDDEADRRVGAGEVVALREIVDELAESAEIDQELDADDVDQRKDHAEPQAHEDGRERGRKQDFPEQLELSEIEAA